MKTSDYSLREAAEDYPDLKALLNGDKRSANSVKEDKKTEKEQPILESPIPSRIQINVNFSPIEVIFRISK